ncbi:MAG: glycosyltransferase family 1 protein [candidate division NC10 bacterium]|nr:glycosyltransferase family 1 protein [candidate division NC10 bacterium]
MRIAHVCAMMRPGTDGVTRVLYKIFDGAPSRSCQVMGIGAAVPRPGETSIPMAHVPSVPLPLQVSYRLALPGSVFFARALKGFKPDLIHLHSPCTLGFAALRFAERHRLPVVATYHTHYPAYLPYYCVDWSSRLVWRLYRSLYNRVDRTLVPTEPVLQELAGQGLRNLECLPHGVDHGLFHPRYRSEAWRQMLGATKKSVLLFVSRLVWEKDLAVLARMFELLKSRRTDFVMVVVGEGQAGPRLASMMPGAVFIGCQTGRALSECYASSDIFVFPSTTETFGNVTVEAMASGLACVAAAKGGAAGLIKDEVSGLLVPPGSPEDMAARVAQLLDDPDRRRVLGEGAVRRAQQFQWQDVLDRLFAIYREILAAAGRKADTRAA